MRKYGVENFQIELLEETDIPEEREVFWIEQKGSFKNGYNASSVLVVNDVVRFAYLWIVLSIIKRYIPISIKKYILYVFVPIILVVVLSGSVSLLAASQLPNTILGDVALGIIAVLVNTLFIAFVGLKGQERAVLVNSIKKRFLKNA